MNVWDRLRRICAVVATFMIHRHSPDVSARPRSEAEAIARILMALDGTEVEVFISIGLRRRLRAYLHRCNASLQAAGHMEDLFDVDDDVVAALTSLAEMGLRADEAEFGLEYDDVTGEPHALDERIT